MMALFLFISFYLLHLTQSEFLCGEICYCYDGYIMCFDGFPLLSSSTKDLILILNVSSTAFLNNIHLWNLTGFKEAFITGKLACTRIDLEAFLVGCEDDDDDEEYDEGSLIGLTTGLFLFCFSFTTIGFIVCARTQFHMWQGRRRDGEPWLIRMMMLLMRASVLRRTEG